MANPEPARIVRHIVVTGSESVGKTMLAAQLAEHYRVLVVPEFVREYAANKKAPLDFAVENSTESRSRKNPGSVRWALRDFCQI